jgi:2-C-methyl-D-erythritol 4-phosphate cytidylyltransferase/2-C-methyl-D-erythritol 2,4-cyclodiphosphate synthase
MSSSTSIGVIIAAAGTSERLGGALPKQWQLLHGISLVERAVQSFSSDSLEAAGQKCLVDHLVLVVDDESRAERLPDVSHFTVAVAKGGRTRAESVRNGFAALPENLDLVAIHDAARPFWPLSRWDDLVEGARTHGGAILGVPMADTVKHVGDGVCTTVDRRGLWLAQTPQVFKASVLREAHLCALNEGFAGTDDAELVERCDGKVAVVASTSSNFKITTLEDWELAESVAGMPDGTAVVRIGIGYDAHRLGGEGPLVLGGVDLAASGGLIGHSDGDVLLHAICDALLGAAALGDIGHHFPPGEDEFAGIDSRILLRRTKGMIQDSGFRIHQIDAVVIAEAPRIAPHVNAMCMAIASDLGIDESSVSVKATTTEGMGFVGRGEGIAAQAIASVVHAPKQQDR